MTAAILVTLLHLLHKLPGGLVYAVVALLVFGEAALFIGFVLPGETSVLVAGVVASQGKINVVWLAALVAVSAVVGDTVGYFIGERYGAKLLELPLIRHRKTAIEKTLVHLRTRGPLYVFLGRFSAFLRAVMPGLAGMSKLQYRRFLVANALGGILWAIAFTTLGYLAGTALNKVASYASSIGLGLLALIVIGFVVLHIRSSRKERD
jgi:membrane-associated protein